MRRSKTARKQERWIPVDTRTRPLDFWRLPADLYPVSRRPLAAQAADQIRRRILIGDLRPGQKLESSRKLARELQISLPVMREALAALSYLGMVDVRQGVGIIVARRQPAARVLRVSQRRARRRELHGLRATLSAEAAVRAALRKLTERQQLDLHLLLDERRRTVTAGDPSAFTDADLEFHAFIGGLSGSPLYASIERVAGSALRAELAGKARRLALDSELDGLHEAIVEAIDTSDSDGARRAALAIATAEGAAPD
jgi:GntR family transcriptional repressor for pyruvate dehydrogenase complex